MLARRFSIVCLLTAIFGMSLASMVAQNDHSMRIARLEAGCHLNPGIGC